jgi:hypothetical protein
MTSRFVREAFVVTALMMWMPLPALAQQTIAGRLISDHSHLPIGNAHLSLLDDSGQVVARTVSDSARGEFFLDAPKAGHYAVSILVGHGGLSVSPVFELDSNQVLQQAFAVPEFPQAVLDAYLPDDVTKRAAMLPGWLRLLRYPDYLRSRDRSGVRCARNLRRRQHRPGGYEDVQGAQVRRVGICPGGSGNGRSHSLFSGRARWDSRVAGV